MAEKLCLAVIKSNYNNLTSKEKLVADYILNNFEKIVTMSVNELSNNAGVVKSVVIRCCKTLGFSGYSEFKIALAGELAKNKEFNFVPYIDKADNCGDVLDKIFSANIKTLNDTALGIDRNVLKNLIDELQKANKIFIYGVGTSSGIVNDFQYRLMQLGFTAFCFTDVASMKVSALNIKSGDVAIGISNSGRTFATVDALKLARENGAKTACLTSFSNSAIIKQSDFPLVIYSDEIEYPIEAISSRIAHISVLDSILISLSAQKYEQAVERSAKTRILLDGIRY